MRSRRRRPRPLAPYIFSVFIPSAAVFGAPSGIPSLSSRSGAAYTIYLDFGGFAFTGTWGGGTSMPGTAKPFNNEAGSSFTSNEVGYMKQVWARVSEKYVMYNINVTTVDPAAASLTGTNYTDPNRQYYYDSHSKMMHTVIGDGTWNGGGGVSYVGTTQNTYTSTTPNGGAGAGWHTDFVFPNALGETNVKNLGEATSHENGHGLGLSHQSDVVANTGTLSEYSENGGKTGNGTIAPVMGDTYYTQRGTWRYGTKDTGAFQNDASVFGNDSGMTLVDDGIGHTMATATVMPLTGTSINAASAKGYIAPGSLKAPTPDGTYTTDFFRFNTKGGSLSLKVTDGGEQITAGTSDGDATLESALTIFASNGSQVAVGSLSTDTLSDAYSGTLAAGQYFAEIQSAGVFTSTYDATAKYYDMGSYFLGGSGFDVPEPGVVVMGLASLLLLRRYRSLQQ